MRKSEIKKLKNLNLWDDDMEKQVVRDKQNFINNLGDNVGAWLLLIGLVVVSIASWIIYALLE